MLGPPAAPAPAQPDAGAAPGDAALGSLSEAGMAALLADALRDLDDGGGLEGPR